MYERSRTTEELTGMHRLSNVVRELSEEVDLGGSVTANISEHRARIHERPVGANAIYEMPDEDEMASSPPGSLSHQDIMSENIQSRLEIHKFKKPKKAAISVLRDDKEDEEISDQVSREGHESQAQAAMPPEAKVSARVELIETSRSIQTFKMTYDRLFKKFQERLIQEYSNMRGGYMSEYQLNYDQNSSRRDDRLVEMNMAIEAQAEYQKELGRVHE